MMREEIISKIDEIINGETTDFNFDKVDLKSNVESFMLNTAMRLAKTYFGFTEGNKGYSDILVALRNFMLVFQTPLRIDSFEIEKDNDFGIYKDDTTNCYYAAYDIAGIVKTKEFVEDAFITKDTSESTKESRYQLKTNGFIKRVTGFNYFKSMEQKLCVYGGLNTPDGFTTLISMPTGGGKSLVTQSLGYEKDGLSIVVVPTVSLAIDQERFAKMNIKIAKDNEIFCYYSGVKNFVDISKAIKNQTAKLLFISPEALIKNEQFQQLVNDANASNYIKNIIIDEAHIVVSWGDFFRIDYQCLGPWRKELLKANPAIRTFLLSATYRDDTVDTLKNMFMNDEKWIEIRCDSLRREPRYILEKKKSFYAKRERVFELVDKLPRPMIIYVNAPYQAKKWKEMLKNRGYSNLKMFTGETKSEERRELIDDWANNEFDIMIATSAFGVGVDKADVRTVMHLYVPENPDSYYQELGRGGRDGLPSLSVMCIEDEDINEGSKHITKVLTKDTFWGRWWSMYTNPSNQWQSGLIAIMTSTKPSYNKINYFEEGNETDEKWNINVLLLLSRFQLIEIVGLDLDDQNRYIFTIKILNDLLIQNTEESKQFFESIRDKEASKSQNAFKLMKQTIDKANDLCWSGMFFDTYPLVSEYCSGCNCHEKIIADELKRFPLLIDVSGPAKQLSLENKEFFADTNEALIISKDNCVVFIENYRPDVVVCDEVIDVDKITRADINYVNFSEFRDLQIRDNEFFISGLVMACYSNQLEIAKKQYQIISKYINKRRHVIHITSSDFVVSNATEKILSDYVGGTVIR